MRPVKQKPADTRPFVIPVILLVAFIFTLALYPSSSSKNAAPVSQKADCTVKK